MESRVHDFSDGFSFDFSRTSYPSRLTCVGSPLQFEDATSSYYGFISRGSCEVALANGKYVLTQGMYFALNGPFHLRPSGQTVVCQRWGYRCLNSFGGPVEKDGRLSYIDGCHSTILVGPARLGDPVFNLLVFPPGVEQTSHLHPTVRLGTVVSGDGWCVMAGQKIRLEPGQVFALSPFETHCFHSGPKGLTVIAYHPDSDVGPTDELHPMKSRTYLR